MSTSRTTRRLLTLTCLGLVSVGCATTVDDGPSEAELTGGEGRELAAEDATQLESEVIVDAEAPATTVPLAGTPNDVLPEIGVDMSRLSSEISGDGDEDETIARIEAGWASIRDQLLDERPDLVNGIQSTVDMARNAVDTNRPADADKAFSILTDLIDSYTGDG